MMPVTAIAERWSMSAATKALDAAPVSICTPLITALATPAIAAIGSRAPWVAFGFTTP